MSRMPEIELEPSAVREIGRKARPYDVYQTQPVNTYRPVTVEMMAQFRTVEIRTGINGSGITTAALIAVMLILCPLVYRAVHEVINALAGPSIHRVIAAAIGPGLDQAAPSKEPAAPTRPQ